MKRFAAVGVVVFAGALWLVASSQGGSDHAHWPIDGQVKKTSSKELRLGRGEVRSWRWSMWATDAPWSASRDRVCFSVDVEGPLEHLPNGGTLGGETGAKHCGPIEAKRGAIAASRVNGGSITPPNGEEESWPEFDVGLAAYRPSVDHVRLVFSDGASEVLKARAVPGHLAFKGNEPFRYALFAVTGCISKFEGLEKGRAVARLIEPKCGER